MSTPRSSSVDDAPRVGWKPFSYDRSVASARLRSFLPCRYLGAAGWSTSIVPADGRGSYDLVVFQKAYREHDLKLAESLAGRGVKIAVDLCDNHLFNPDGIPHFQERADGLRRMLELVDAVSVSTPALAQVLGLDDAVVIDDALEVPRLNPVVAAWHQADARFRRRLGRPTRLVWFGFSGFDNPDFGGIAHLAQVLPHLERLDRSETLSLTVISNSEAMFHEHVGKARFPVHFVPWTAGGFARHFAANDICLLPIEQTPFTIGKTSNRLVLSLMLGVPVVSSVIPSYQEFGQWVLFDDWEESVRLYATDSELVSGHVSGAREHIRRTYTPDHVVGQWGRLLESVLA